MTFPVVLLVLAAVAAVALVVRHRRWGVAFHSRTAPWISRSVMRSRRSVSCSIRPW